MERHLILLIALIAVLCVISVVAYFINKYQATILAKAEKSRNMLNFYHLLAKFTEPLYKSYNMTEEEKKKYNEFYSKHTVYDTHPIGGYYQQLRNLKDTISSCGNFHNYKLSFNMSEIGIGILTMCIFALVVFLGVYFK